jgi:hypothetical protein
LEYFNNKKIPILNQSFNELLNFLSPIEDKYQEVNNQLEHLKTNLDKGFKLLDETVLNPSLLAQLPSTAQDILQNSLIIFSNAIDALPIAGSDIPDIFQQGIPSQLIAAIEPLKGAILNLPNDTFDHLKTQLNQAIASLPNAIDKTPLNTAKEAFYDVINNPVDIDQVSQSFDALKVAVNQILDTAIAQALRQFQRN